ncbi:MAG TPA: phosphotransferase family protein [Gammaproteobacteria bacterium]|nr:phosphotransferase family protein [Gammaproteobacteria bacterium]
MNTRADLDITRLQRYLQHAAPSVGAIRSAEKFSGGQSNPTYLLHTEEGQYVLRSKPKGKLLNSAHAVEREFRVMGALAHSPVPVPSVLCLCEDLEVIDTVFFVMSHEDGPIFWDPALPELALDERTALYQDEIRVLAALHSLDPVHIGLADFGRPGSYFARQVKRWTDQYRASETMFINTMESLMRWLAEHLPDDDGQTALLHGDYRLDNLIMTHDQVHIQAVIDWELSTLGHPFADLAYFCMCLRMPNYEQIRGLAGVDRAGLGIPEEADIIRQYCTLRGIDDIDDWPFYLAFSFFRLAAICQGVLKRSLDGNASSEQAAKVGGLTPLLSEMGLKIAISREE